MNRHATLLQSLGTRVRHLRLRQRFTLRNVAGRSGLSVRFLTQLASGVGNISVGRLADVATALNTSLAALFADPSTPPQPLIVALVGLRGAGKTTVGLRVARKLGCPFVELDQRIEEAANLGLTELFALHGERYYRRLELDAVRTLLATPADMVLATGGGLVSSPEAYGLIREAALTVWLRASPATHLSRVVRHGERRPTTDHPQAIGDLRALLAEREPLYKQASVVVDTTKRTAAKSADAVVAALRRHTVGRHPTGGRAATG
ncbi:MAG: shikimate kinase [Vicinamibacterales bacterium]